MAPYHWQRGISLYYAGEFDKGAKQFELHKTVNPQDVENAVWHFLCVARLAGVEKAREKLIPIHANARVPMMQVHELFAGRGSTQAVMDAVKAGEPDESSLKNRLFYAHLYLGLYDEALSKPESARDHLQMAEKYASEDYMGDVARVHVRVLKENAVVPKSTATLVAGTGLTSRPVLATQARVDKPFAVAFDNAGNMYIGEYGGFRVRKVDQGGILTTLAGTGIAGFSGDGGPAIHGQFNRIHDLVTGPDDNIYVADSDNRRVRKIDTHTGILTTFAGNGEKIASGDGGTAETAGLDGVASLYFDPAGTTLYVSGFSKVVRSVIDMKTHQISTIDHLPGGQSIAMDSKGNLYIAGGQSLHVRTPDDVVHTLIDKTRLGGSTLPLGNNPKHLAIDAHDNVLLCDDEHHLIRKYSPADGTLTIVAGTEKPGTFGLERSAKLSFNSTARTACMFIPRPRDLCRRQLERPGAKDRTVKPGLCFTKTENYFAQLERFSGW